MKKLIGFGFILAALAVITFSIIGYPKIDANLWPSSPLTANIIFFQYPIQWSSFLLF